MLTENFLQNKTLEKLLKNELEKLSLEEGLDSEDILKAISSGEMVLLGNPAHKNVKALLVGSPSRVKVNANIGSSPLDNCFKSEEVKLKAALDAGADTIMDLSIAGDLDALRLNVLKNCEKPIGSVPIYAVAQQLQEAGRSIASMTKDDLFKEIEKQAEQGIDFITAHCGTSMRAAKMALGDKRLMGVVSRGGSMLSRWMLENNKENPLLEDFDRLLDICRPYNLVISLGDGLRPGAGSDAGDAAQWEELIELGRLASYALESGVQCMIEGPGHVPLNQVKSHIKAIKLLTNNAPLYVLGPLCCDSSPGYDHISGAIGGALAVEAGVDFLCYLTPAEHLALPDKDDVYQGVMASRIAAHVGEIALGRPHALLREESMNKARKALDWDKMALYALDPEMLRKRREKDKKEEVCSMCGEFCALKMLDKF